MIALCLLGVFVIVYFAMWKGIKSSGKVTQFKSTRFRGNKLYSRRKLNLTKFS